jgi:hypothetical protein
MMFTVPLPSARPPYCLRRHTLLLHGCLATVVNKRHIAYSMHVTILSGRWCDIVVLNVHATVENKTDDTKDIFREVLERVFNQFPKSHMKIFLDISVPK